MYPRNGSNESGAGARGSFGDNFLGAMEDETEILSALPEDSTEEEDALPMIEEDVLDGGYQDIELMEASLDEPLPGMERTVELREEAWDFGASDYRESADVSPTGSFDSVSDGSGYGASDQFSRDQIFTADDGEVYEPESSYELLGAIDEFTGGVAEVVEVESTGYEPVDPDSAFDEIEEQEDDFTGSDLESMLANIGRGDPAPGAEESHDDEHEDGAKEKLKSNFKISEEDEELMQGFEIDRIISLAIELGASDIHIKPNERIGFRINGDFSVTNRFDVIPAEVTRRIQQKIVTNVADDIFLTKWELDTSYTVKSGPHRGRRVRMSVTKGGLETVMVMRLIAPSIPLPHELEIEDELLEWADLPNGLVLMNGPTGTGKSTTLASMIQDIQKKLPGVIITIEKPVEYLYDERNGIARVYQREVGRDTLSFSAALDSAMRMDPDVILIGEMRNSMEAEAVIYAADTGHLSLSTTHANSAAQTVTRVQRMFSGDERRQAMESLATVSRGFASQVLCRTEGSTKPGETSRFAVREILTVTDEISDLIMQGDARGIRRLQEERGITLEHGLLRAVQAGRCTPEEARRKSTERSYFDYLRSEAAKLL